LEAARTLVVALVLPAMSPPPPAATCTVDPTTLVKPTWVVDMSFTGAGFPALGPLVNTPLKVALGAKAAEGEVGHVALMVLWAALKAACPGSVMVAVEVEASHDTMLKSRRGMTNCRGGDKVRASLPPLPPPEAPTGAPLGR